ncbi:hybrid sensor histidine kinase/response regulator [Thiomicrorhabdus xiamenensis]|uniref:histidine kinase n=1 Tax=Thiomicrorhabdus xiamenensis TaxID=2739063 RepID=A0A7D4SJA8_9GAMM|nr:ATP-binding protein [Thiomicrorhabdus xiamenensis]QKI89719.1 response regulator [Thiomicrorhabdus xiamenensis]
MTTRITEKKPSIVTRTGINLFLLLIIFILGLGAQAILNFSITNYTNELDKKIRNAEVENNLGLEVILEIYKIEASFFQVTAFPNKHLRKIIEHEIEESQEEITHVLQVLNQGGTYKHNLDLNLPNTEEQFEIMFYKPITADQFSFAEADVLPKLGLITHKIKELNQLLKQIDRYRLTQDPRLGKSISTLKLEVKLFEPIFHRLKEDANQIFYTHRLNFTQIRKEVEEQKRFYKSLQIFLTLFLLIAGLYAFWRLSRNIHRTSQEIEKTHDYTRDILNSQDNIIIVNDGEKIIDVSGGFFKFFYEYPDLDAFSADYNCVCDLFVKEEGLVYKFEDKSWIEYVVENPNKTHKAKLRYHGTEHIYKIYGQKSKKYQRYIISLLDITEFEKINRDLQEQKNRALEATRSKGEFLANMSHEIRTPLNAILGFIDLLKEKPLDPEGKKYLETVTQSSHTLLGIINDILDLTKIESGKLDIDISEFSPKDELTGVADLFRARCSEKNINFVTHFAENLPGGIKSDALRIKQVISNLLSNAVKFTDPGKTITLDISYNPGWLRISVEDEGIGMTREAQEKIFEAFSQAETSTTRKYGGTGLGLTISSRLIKMLGGSLKVTSRLGEGSKFYFSIPVQAVELTQKTQAPAEGKELVRYSGDILLVEDNKTNQMLMVAILKKFGLSCLIANDGLEALEQAKNRRFDLILMDENMPNLNGIEATRQIREHEKQSGAHRQHIVALTANAMTGDRERFIEAGMDEYLTKPVNIGELTKVFEKFLPKK